MFLSLNLLHYDLNNEALLTAFDLAIFSFTYAVAQAMTIRRRRGLYSIIPATISGMTIMVLSPISVILGMAAGGTILPVIEVFIHGRLAGLSNREVRSLLTSGRTFSLFSFSVILSVLALEMAYISSTFQPFILLLPLSVESIVVAALSVSVTGLYLYKQSSLIARLMNWSSDIQHRAAESLEELINQAKRSESLFLHLSSIDKLNANYRSKFLKALKENPKLLDHLEEIKQIPELLDEALRKLDLIQRPDALRYLRGVKLPKRLEDQVVQLAIEGNKDALDFLLHDPSFLRKIVLERPSLSSRLSEPLTKIAPSEIKNLPDKFPVLALITDERLLEFFEDIAIGLAEGDPLAAKAFLNLARVSPEAAYRLIKVLDVVDFNDDIRMALAEIAKNGYNIKRIALKDEKLMATLVDYLDAETLIEGLRRGMNVSDALEKLAEDRPEDLTPYLDELREYGLKTVVARVLAKLAKEKSYIATKGSLRKELVERSEWLNCLPIKLPSLKLKKAEGSFGNYEILAFIDEGSYSVVYLAKHRFLGKKVALKVMKLNETFIRELEALKRLRHEHILSIIDAGVEGDKQYLVLELGAGSLASYRGKLNDEQAAYLLGSLASALSYAHSQGVVHGDVKPSNVILFGEECYVPKLADFSIARLIDPERTRSMSGVKGSPGFLDPSLTSKPSEKITFEDYVTADIYSLGLTVGLYLKRSSVLRDLVNKMTSPLPDSRPSIEEVLEVVERILQVI